MEDIYNQIFINFYIATNLNLYVLNQKNKVVEHYTTPLAPQLPQELIDKAVLDSELSVYLITNQSSLGIFELNNFKIIGWNTNFTIGEKDVYSRKAPLLGYQQFIHLMNCLFFMCYQKWPKINSNKIQPLIGENINSKENTTATYEGYTSEMELMNAVTNGKLEQFNKRFTTFIKKGNFGSFGQNKIRNMKDMAIAATTLYTRAAIKGGLPVAEAYKLSDKIIKQIEYDKNILNYYEYTRAIGEIFINHVSRVRRINLTSITYQAQEYITANFATITNVDEVAHYLKISTSYLQHLFKKETGQSLIQFINEEKITQAKHELIFSTKSIAEIAYDLGYKNQSQLSTIFKKSIGISPLDFRKQYK